MTVAELIEKLRNYPPGMLVVVQGWEGGYDAVEDIGIVDIVYDPSESYFGEYRRSEREDTSYIDAILLPRKS
jgi:hypothetical protein